MRPVFDLKELSDILHVQDVVLIYFSNETCNVCKVLRPKVSELKGMQFPKAELIYIDTEKSPLIAGQHRVFTIPTILLYIQGKEQARFSRNINMFELESAIAKPYGIIFED